MIENYHEQSTKNAANCLKKQAEVRMSFTLKRNSYTILRKKGEEKNIEVQKW